MKANQLQVELKVFSSLVKIYGEPSSLRVLNELNRCGSGHGKLPFGDVLVMLFVEVKLKPQNSEARLRSNANDCSSCHEIQVHD